MIYLSAQPELDRHDTGPGHPEHPGRVPAALNGLREAGLSEAIVEVPARAATREELELVHHSAYLDRLEQFCRSGGGHLCPDTVAGPGSWETALRAVGGTLAAVEALDKAGEGFAFVAQRPPGHHATAERAMGFCLLNAVAVAAAYLASRGERALVLDWDVHHGNGTEAIFWEDSRVLYVSSHQSPLYPGTGPVNATGGAAAPGLNINLPVPPGATGDVLLEAYEEVAGPVIRGFAPTWVLVSCGFDGHRADPLADLALSAGDYAELAKWAAGLPPAPGRLVIVMEGGYDLGAVSMSSGAMFSALLGGRYRPEAPTSGGPGREVVTAAKRARAAAGLAV
jgi:acetoin utilization deacetylase AcuC-like enzyme